MNDTPLVSVVTPTYQSAHTLPRALRSLQNQTYENWEWVVVDDGSTDHTPAFLSEQSDPRIRHLTLEENQGRGFVRNLTLQQARGEYICALDADDWFYPHKLDQQVQALSSDPTLAAVTMGMVVTDDRGELIGTEGRIGVTADKEISGPLALRFPFGPTMIRRELALQTGYDTTLRRGDDLDFFLRLLCGNGRRLRHLATLGYVYQGHTDSTISQLLNGHAWSRKVYRAHLRAFPKDCTVLLLASMLKSCLYLGSRYLGLAEWLSYRRFAPYSTGEMEQYLAEVKSLQR